MDLLEHFKAKKLKEYNKVIRIAIEPSLPQKIDINQKYQLMSNTINNSLGQITQLGLSIPRKLFSYIKQVRIFNPNEANAVQARFEPLLALLSEMQKEFQTLMQEYGNLGSQANDLTNAGLGEVKQDLTSLSQLLDKLSIDSKKIFSDIQYEQNNQNIIKLRWESAYLSNACGRFLKEIVGTYNNNEMWKDSTPTIKPIDNNPPKQELPIIQPKEKEPSNLLNLDFDETGIPELDAGLPVLPVDPKAEMNPGFKQPIKPKPSDTSLDTKPELPKVFDDTNSKLAPLPTNNITNIRGFSFRKPEGAKWDIGQTLPRIGVINNAVCIGYIKGRTKMDSYGHEIIYVLEYLNKAGQKKYYTFEPYQGGINHFTPYQNLK